MAALCVFIGSMGRNSKSRKGSVAALVVVCFLLALDLLRADLLPNLIPNLLPPFERQAVPFVLLALVAGAFAFVRRAAWPGGVLLRSFVLVGPWFFAAPSFLICLANGRVPGLARVALFSLVPVFALVFEPYFGAGAGQLRRSGLLAALAGVVGALCVFPVTFPESIDTARGFLAVILATVCVAAANCWAVRVACELPPQSTAPMAAIAGASVALTFAILSAFTERTVWTWGALAPELTWAAVVETPALLLLFWLLRRMSATRMTTRYTIAPLFAVLTGVALMRPRLELRSWLGLVAMAAGAGYLLFAPEQEAEATGLSLHRE
jgi:drug/metabolite transporter (DMT)-like permease